MKTQEKLCEFLINYVKKRGKTFEIKLHISYFYFP
jgi:hypothetical protein